MKGAAHLAPDLDMFLGVDVDMDTAGDEDEDEDGDELDDIGGMPRYISISFFKALFSRAVVPV